MKIEYPQRIEDIKPAKRRTHRNAKRELRQALATPKWVDIEAVLSIYDTAESLRRDGVHVAVDHVVPIMHPQVCGLHVPWNLRIVSKRTNALKSNVLDELGSDAADENRASGRVSRSVITANRVKERVARRADECYHGKPLGSDRTYGIGCAACAHLNQHADTAAAIERAHQDALREEFMALASRKRRKRRASK